MENCPIFKSFFFNFQMENPDNIIEIQNASFLAGSGDSEQLKNISVEIKSRSLTAIVGQFCKTSQKTGSRYVFVHPTTLIL